MKDYITIIGGGLAGSEAAYQIAKRGIKVKLYEMKPGKFSPAHSNQNLAEIVCSNSLKSNLHTNACGLLKEELRKLDSLLIRIADETSVPAGQALAVDREVFSEKVTRELEKMPNIEIIRKEVGMNKEEEVSNQEEVKDKDTQAKQQIENVETEITLSKLLKEGIVIIATGPLTSDNLSKEIASLTGENKLYFYDAAAPIIEKDSIDMSIAFWGDRYDQERKKEESIEQWIKRIGKYTTSNQMANNEKQADYLNLPMNKEEYENFWESLVSAQVVNLHEFEKREIFEGCMPIEIMAKRGKDTLRFGPLKPVGFTDPRTGKRPYAVVQLRQDNKQGNLYNMVGFQTNLKFAEQAKVFAMIPGLQNASFAKYGVMHRNTYINSTKLLNRAYQMKTNSNVYFAGQITGVEGYVESISSGLVAAINAVKNYKLENNIIFPENTMIGALAKYISTENEHFQPMNANFGILPPLEEKIKDKKLKYTKLADRALEGLEYAIFNKISYSSGDSIKY